MSGKIDKSIEDFKFNVSIAHFYEIYKVFIKYFDQEITNEIMRECLIKMMKLLIPFTPHLAHECLENLNCKNIDIWPEINSNEMGEIKFAIQVNGKTRDIITIQKDLKEEQIDKIIRKDSKARKFIEKKEIYKTIFVKGKIINYIIK